MTRTMLLNRWAEVRFDLAGRLSRLAQIACIVVIELAFWSIVVGVFGGIAIFMIFGGQV